MTVLVRFRTAGGAYAVPVDHALEVRSAAGLVALPAPAPGVAGVIERQGVTVPVVCVLGGGHRHVVVVSDGDEAAGILADEVLGVSRPPEGSLGPPPPGQETPLVRSVVREDGAMTFVVDVPELLRHVRDHTLDQLGLPDQAGITNEPQGTAEFEDAAEPDGTAEDTDATDEPAGLDAGEPVA